MMASDYNFELSSGVTTLRTTRSQPPSTFLLKIQNFSLLMNSDTEQKSKSSGPQIYESQEFRADGYTWKLILYPNGEDGHKDHISLYLQIQETEFLPTNWEVNVEMKLCALKQDDNKFLIVRDLDAKRFNARRTQCGFTRFLPFATFNDPENGYLVNDSCEFGAEIFIIKPSQKVESPVFVKDPETNNISFTIESSPILDTEPATMVSNPSNRSEIQRTSRDFIPTHCNFPISSFSRLCDEGKESLESAAFDVGGFKWMLALYPKGRNDGGKVGRILLYLRILETEDFPEDWKVHAFFRFFIRDQNNDKYLMIQEPPRKEIKCFHEIKKEYGIELLSFEELCNPSKGYLVEDRCYFGAEVFVLSPTKSFLPVELAPDGTYLWTIENFSNVRNMESYINSKPFSFGGIQWKLKVYPKGNGRGKNKSLSLFLNTLNAPRNKKYQVNYTVTLLNTVTGNHHSGTAADNFNYVNPTWGWSEFLSLENMNEEKGYIAEGDKMYLQVKFNSIIVEESINKKGV